MHSSKRSPFRFFFSHNLKKYIDDRLYALQGSEKLFDLFLNCGERDVHRWEKLPVGYLSHHESLCLGLARAFQKGGSRIHHDQSFRDILRLFEKYFEQQHKKSEHAQSFALLSLGVIFLERALFESVEKQRKFLTLSRHYLDEAEEGVKSSKESDSTAKKLLEVTYLYRTLVEVCMDELPQGVKYLSKAAKISSNAKPLWKILSSIYHHLGMTQVSHFYRKKASGHPAGQPSPRPGHGDHSQMAV